VRSITAAGLTLSAGAIAQVHNGLPGSEPEPAPNVDVPLPQPFLDPDLVRPIEIDAVGPGGHAPDAGQVVYKNLVTGRVKQFLPNQIPDGAFDEDFEEGTFDLGEDEHFVRNFGSLSEVSDPTAYPWRVNVRLIMEWYTDGGTFQGSGSCSGTLIDGRHVLTANHCTFDRDGLGWADKIYVYPAYDSSEHEPFGVSEAVGVIGWTGYVSNGDWNYDMSVIILGRPIGGITGWHGYGFNSGCSFFTDNTFHNASYPAEGAYGFNGGQMYYRYGTFDDCTEVNLKKYNSLAYKGMSGSSAYYINDDSRYAYAVTSHRRGNGSGDCDATWCTYLTAMWSDFFYYTRDTLMPGTYGNSVDFYPMWVKTSSSFITAGSPIPNFSYYCYNNSDGSFNGTVSADLYVSNNNVISTSDKKLGTLAFNWSTGGRGRAFLSYDDLVVIPNDFVTEGQYYLGVIITNNDADNGNNDSSGQEAMLVTIDAKPDLMPASMNAQNGTYNQLDTLPVDFSVKNLGGDDCSSYSIDIRASLNTTITTGDPLVATINGGSIGAFQTETFSVDPVIPQSVAAGLYYIGVIVNSNDPEFSTSNNTTYDATRVEITDLADLEVSAVLAADGTYSEGDTLPVSFTVKNVGTEPSGSYGYKIRASPNTTFTDADYLLGELTGIGGLGIGQSRDISRNITVPGGIDPGQYYIGVTIETAQDSDGDNNTGYDRVRVTFGEDCTADFNGDGVVNTQDFISFLNLWTAGC
jgi:V8-like Glu-specific endopeptidase